MKILIFASGGGIGDTLIITPMFRAIKEKYPNSFLAVGVASDLSMKILESNKLIDYLFKYNKFFNKRYIGLAEGVSFLRKIHFDYCFQTETSGSPFFYIAPFLAGIRNRIGYDRRNIPKRKHNRLFSKLLTKSVQYYVGDGRRRVEKNLECLREIGIVSHNLDYDFPVLADGDVRKYDLVGIHLGCGGNKRLQILKRWNIEKYNELALKIIQAYDYTIRFYLGPDEKEFTRYICPHEKIEIVIEQNIIEVAKNIAECGYFISNDSGLSHMAAALKIPTVVIYGGTVSSDFDLPTKHINVEKELSCRPCYHLKCRCEREILCLRDISVDEVYYGFEKLVNSEKAPK